MEMLIPPSAMSLDRRAPWLVLWDFAEHPSYQPKFVRVAF